MIKLKRIYEPPGADDGFRILVERLWPRGFTKERAHIDLWLKDIAPSPALRTWYAHDVARWDEFVRRYQAELRENPLLGDLRAILHEHPVVTFLFAARDLEHNSAQVLKASLEQEAAA